MPHRKKILDAFSRLLTYPDEHTVQTAEFLFVVLQGEVPEAASAAAEFGAFAEQSEVADIEEAFTRTFDVNPTCALEVGWHLFGEEYARGMFLVRMREEMRKYNLPESVELPDHLSHVLAIVAAMPDDESARFVGACVLPAIEILKAALDENDSPYRHVVSALAAMMEQTWGVVPVAQVESRAERQAAGAPPGFQPSVNDSRLSLTPGDDPLNRVFHAADFTGCCGSGCGGEPEITPLQMSYSTGGQVEGRESRDENQPAGDSGSRPSTLDSRLSTPTEARKP